VGTASTQPWPVHDEAFLVESEAEYVVQINGKVRDRVRVPIHAEKEEIEKLVLASTKVAEAVAGHAIVKIIVVPGKLVNIVVKPA
jgi:leucyl-tRNA synthetase